MMRLVCFKSEFLQKESLNIANVSTLNNTIGETKNIPNNFNIDINKLKSEQEIEQYIEVMDTTIVILRNY